MKKAYILVTDLHYNVVKENRLNYFGEILNAMADIMSLAEKYRNDGCTVNIILMGDVIDKGLQDAEDAMQAVVLLTHFLEHFDEGFALIGNHETTYIDKNPFWFLVSSIEDSKLSKIRRPVQPKGVKGLLKVTDYLSDGEVHFHFNHHGVPAMVPKTAGINIGLFHQNVGSNDICKMWGTFEDVEEASYIQAYNYCFFAHMHKARGTYKLNASGTCVGEWLGTIGRTNITEVEELALNVSVPVVLVEDGVFKQIDRNTITLMPAGECIDYDKVKAQKASKEHIKEREEALKKCFVGDTLLQAIQIAVSGTALEVILNVCNQPEELMKHAYKDSLKEFLE